MRDVRDNNPWFGLPIVLMLLIATVAGTLSARKTVSGLREVRADYDSIVATWLELQHHGGNLLFASDVRSVAPQWVDAKRRLESLYTNRFGTEQADRPLSVEIETRVTETNEIWSGLNAVLSETEQLLSALDDRSTDPSNDPPSADELFELAGRLQAVERTFIENLQAMSQLIESEVNAHLTILTLIGVFGGSAILLGAFIILLVRYRFDIRQQLYLSTISNMIDGVIITDSRERIVYANRTVEKILQVEQKQLMGSPRLAEIAPQIYDGNSSGIFTIGPKFQPISVSHRAIYSELGGNRLGEMYVLRDMTTFLKDHKDSVEQSKLESLGMLAGGLSHDFNNTLAVILGNVEVLSLSLHDGEQRQLLDSIREGIDRSRELSRKLLVYAESGGSEATRIDPVALLRSALAGLDLPDTIHVNLAYDAEQPLILGNEQNLTEALRELISNAREAITGEGTIAIAIEHHPRGAAFAVGEESAKADTDLTFRIDDNGSGIPYADLQRVFDPFFTTSENRKGMGLPVAYAVVRAHGGNISLNSEPDHGTTAAITLPAYAATRAGSPREAADARSASGAIPAADAKPSA